MNEKHAKALRRKVANHPDAHLIPQETSYVQRNTRIRRFYLPHLSLDDEGNVRFVDLQMRQIKPTYARMMTANADPPELEKSSTMSTRSPDRT